MMEDRGASDDPTEYAEMGNSILDMPTNAQRIVRSAFDMYLNIYNNIYIIYGYLAGCGQQ